MHRYITRGIANKVPQPIQQQIWDIVARRERKAIDNNEADIDYCHIINFKTYQNELYIKHIQEVPDYFTYHKSNYNTKMHIDKVYVIHEDDVDLTYYVMLLPEEY